jgi:hypothetical protein
MEPRHEKTHNPSPRRDCQRDHPQPSPELQHLDRDAIITG